MRQATLLMGTNEWTPEDLPNPAVTRLARQGGEGGVNQLTWGPRCLIVLAVILLRARGCRARSILHLRSSAMWKLLTGWREAENRKRNRKQVRETQRTSTCRHQIGSLPSPSMWAWIMLTAAPIMCKQAENRSHAGGLNACALSLPEPHYQAVTAGAAQWLMATAQASLEHTSSGRCWVEAAGRAP